MDWLLVPLAERAWKRGKMKIPARLVPKKMRLRWILEQPALIGMIDHARSAENSGRLFQSSKPLYAQLRSNGISTPVLTDPSDDLDSWYEYHQDFLFGLKQRILERNFDLDQWNKRVQALEEDQQQAGLPPPNLNQGILKFLIELEKENRRMTNHDVFAHFLDVRPVALDNRLITLKESGCISATVTPKPTLGIPENKHIEIHGVTKKGKEA